MSLTAEDARKIADTFLEAANEVDAYLDANFNIITRGEYEFLYESFKTLIRVSSFATSAAVGLAIGELQNPATEITGVISQAKAKIKNLQLVGTVINVVANLTDLAAGIMSKDPKSIASSVTNLVKVLA